MIRKKAFAVVAVSLLLVAGYVYWTLCGSRAEVRGRVVLCIPVYGQSLALGEEAVRVTDFDQLRAFHGGRIVTENIDGRFGYFDLDATKQQVKKLLHRQNRSFELSVYGMAELLAGQLGEDTLICIFPGGKGTTDLANLGKGSEPYNRLLCDLMEACSYVTSNGGRFLVPAICWMQGESDIADYPGTDYKAMLRQFSRDINDHVKAITGQQESARLICYQTNALTRGNRFSQHDYVCCEVGVPQAMMELIRDDTLFWASGPTYPYSFAREAIHIDGVSQKRLGTLEGLTALRLLRNAPRFRGLVPLQVVARDSDVVVKMNVPCPPLRLDTLAVRAARHYGFSVVTPSGRDVATGVAVSGDEVTVRCSQSPVGCKVRYAVNGEMQKSGSEHGPRGNLRDSQGDAHTVSVCGKVYPLHNWCYQFEELVR